MSGCSLILMIHTCWLWNCRIVVGCVHVALMWIGCLVDWCSGWYCMVMAWLMLIYSIFLHCLNCFEFVSAWLYYIIVMACRLLWTTGELLCFVDKLLTMIKLKLESCRLLEVLWHALHVANHFALWCLLAA